MFSHFIWLHAAGTHDNNASDLLRSWILCVCVFTFFLYTSISRTLLTTIKPFCRSMSCVWSDFFEGTVRFAISLPMIFMLCIKYGLHLNGFFLCKWQFTWFVGNAWKSKIFRIIFYFMAIYARIFYIGMNHLLRDTRKITIEKYKEYISRRITKTPIVKNRNKPKLCQYIWFESYISTLSNSDSVENWHENGVVLCKKFAWKQHNKPNKSTSATNKNRFSNWLKKRVKNYNACGWFNKKKCYYTQKTDIKRSKSHEILLKLHERASLYLSTECLCKKKKLETATKKRKEKAATKILFEHQKAQCTLKWCRRVMMQCRTTIVRR